MKTKKSLNYKEGHNKSLTFPENIFNHFQF